MDEQGKKTHHWGDESYLPLSGTSEFDPQELGNLGEKLKKDLQHLLIQPREEFLNQIDEYSDTIPVEIRTSLEKIKAVEEEDPELAAALRKNYLESIQAYVDELELSFKNLFLFSLLFLPAFVGFLGSPLQRPESLNSPGEFLAYIVVSFFLYMANRKLTIPLVQRVRNPQRYVIQTFRNIQEKVERDLVTIESGFVPSRYRRKLKRALVGKEEVEKQAAKFADAMKNLDDGIFSFGDEIPVVDDAKESDAKNA
jgi:hypothetical protein